VQYEHKATEKFFRNGLPFECYQSVEIHAMEDKRGLTDEGVAAFRKAFEAKVVA